MEGGGGVLSIDQNRVAITLLSTFSTYSARSLISCNQNISRVALAQLNPVDSIPTTSNRSQADLLILCHSFLGNRTEPSKTMGECYWARKVKEDSFCRLFSMMET